jgi:parallel beta-helix repeat protein
MNPRRTSSILSVLALMGVVLFSPSAAVNAQTLTVDCDAGQRLQTAIDQARPGDTVVVSGFCAENVLIGEDAARITLDGQGTATIHNPLPAAPTISILGRGMTVRGFTITGGRNGINVIGGGTAVIDSNVIQETGAAGQPGSGVGINVAQHSYAIVISNTIQSNPSSGVNVIEGSYARIGYRDPADPTTRGNIIRGNGRDAVRVNSVSGASIAGNTISDNTGPGVSVTGASNATVSANRIDGNSTDGIMVTQNSAIQLGGAGSGPSPAPNETAVPNQGFGISCSLNSSVIGRLATLTGASGPRDFDPSCSDNLVP